jgi:probable rRNA maturation factor
MDRGAGDPPLRRTRAAGLAVDVALEGVRLPLSRERVRRIAQHALRREGVRDAIVSFAFVTARAIAALNRRVLRHTGPTDVITLAFHPAGKGAPLVADVYVAPEVVRRNAAAAGVTAREELARVVVHAVLHALGARHPEGEARERSAMWRRQERTLAAAKRDGLW